MAGEVESALLGKDELGAALARTLGTAPVALMRELQIPAGAVRTPEESVPMIRGLRAGAVSDALPSGEHVPVFPALFDGRLLPRSATPHVGGARRPLTPSPQPSPPSTGETEPGPAPSPACGRGLG